MENEFNIDSDEGYRPGEAFFTHALPCESCGAPVATRNPAEWDSTLLVGPCCEFASAEIPDESVCPELLKVIENCSLVSSVSAAMEAHRECCQTCTALTMRRAA